MCYANVAMQAAASALRALGKHDLIGLSANEGGLGLTCDVSMNSKTTIQFAQHAFAGGMQNAHEQNDYSEVLLSLMAHISFLGNAATTTICTVFDCESSGKIVISEHQERFLQNYAPSIGHGLVNLTNVNPDSIDDPDTYCKACSASWAMENLLFGPEPCRDTNFDAWWERVGQLPYSHPEREVLGQISQQCTNNGSRFRHEEVTLLGDILWIHYPTRVVFMNGQASIRANFHVKLESLSLNCDTDSMALCTAIFHTGTSTTGHYTCLVRKKVDQWHLINDDTISKEMTDVGAWLYLQREPVQISIVGLMFVRVDTDLSEGAAAMKQATEVAATKQVAAEAATAAKQAKEAATTKQAKKAAATKHAEKAATAKHVQEEEEPSPRTNPQSQPRGHPPKGKQWDNILGKWVHVVPRTPETRHPQPRGRPKKHHHWDGVIGKWIPDSDGAVGEWTPQKKHKSYLVQYGDEQRDVVFEPTPDNIWGKLQHHQTLRDRRIALVKVMRDEAKRKANTRATASRRAMVGEDALQRDVSSNVASKYNEPKVSKLFEKNLQSMFVAPRLQSLEGRERRECAAQIAAEQDASICLSDRCDWCCESGLRLTLQDGTVLGMDITQVGNAMLCHACRTFAKGHQGSRPPLAQVASNPGYCLESLVPMTLAEEMMVSRVHVRHAVYTVRQVAVKYKGHASFYVQDTSWVSELLPLNPYTLPLVLVRSHDVAAEEVAHVDLVVRPDVVIEWLRYKKRTDPHYEDAEIDEVLLEEMKERAVQGGSSMSPTTHDAFSVATDIESVVSSEWDLRTFRKNIEASNSLDTLLCALAQASKHPELSQEPFESKESLIASVREMPSNIGAFNIRQVQIFEEFFKALRTLCDEANASLTLHALLQICSELTPLVSMLDVVVALCFFSKQGDPMSTHVKGLRLGLFQHKLHSGDDWGSLVSDVIEAWSSNLQKYAGCAALESWEVGGAMTFPVRLCGPLCCCEHSDCCCCGGRLCKQNANASDTTTDAGGAGFDAMHMDANRDNADDEASLEYSMFPFGGMLETRDEIADNLGFDQPKHAPTFVRGAHNRNSMIRALDFEETSVGAEATAMELPVSSYPGMGLAAAPRVTKDPVGTSPHVQHKVDQRKRLSLFNSDIRGLVSMAFPSLVHNKLYDFFCPDTSVSETLMFRHLMAYTTPDGKMPFLEHPTFKYCMQNVVWRRQNNVLKSRVVNRDYQGMSLADFRSAVEQNPNILKKIRSSTSSRPGSSGFWWRFVKQLFNFTWHYQWASEKLAAVGPTADHVPDQMFTIFYTVSTADAWWPVFHTQCTPNSEAKVLSDNITPDSYEDYRERSRKVRHYVGLASQYAHWKHQVLLNGFVRAAWGIIAHAWRVEMQKRMAIHHHGCVMLKHAPTLNMCMRACDAFQQHTTPDACKNRPRLPEDGGNLELWDAVLEIVRYCDNILGITGSDPWKCLCKSRDKSYRAVKTHLSELVDVGDWDDIYTDLLRTAFEHRHSRVYCLRLRKHKTEQKVQYSVQTAPRSELKCRFDAPWPACMCQGCGPTNKQCRQTRANSNHPADCAWESTTQVVFNCTCDEVSKGHQCKCDSKCHRGCHVHVTRNSNDESSKRNFKVWPCRNHHMINCHVREAALVVMGNCDFQFMMDGLHSVEYMAKYMGKDEPCNPELVRNMKLATAAFKAPPWASEDDASGLKALVQCLLNAQSGGRAYGMWEVSLIAQGVPLFGFSESKAELRLGGACNLSALETEDADAPDEDGGNGTKKLKLENDFVWYNSRPAHHQGIEMYSEKSQFTEKFKARESPAWVNVTPRLDCELPVWGASGDDLREATTKLENWCVHQLLMFQPWRVHVDFRGDQLYQAAKDVVKGEYESYHAAFRACLPRWLLRYEEELANREAPLSTIPLTLDEWRPVESLRYATIPRKVIYDYHKAVAARGYKGEVGGDHDNDENDWDSEGEDASERGLDGKENPLDNLNDASSSESEGYELSDDEDAVREEDFTSENDDFLMDLTDLQDEMDDALQLETELMEPHLAQTVSEIATFNVVTHNGSLESAQSWLKDQRREVGDEHNLTAADVADPATLESNPWQAELFQYVMDCVSQCTQSFVIVQGEGGTGKSHVVKCWRHPSALGSQIAVLAPTGVAALNIKGATIAQFLGFYPNRKYQQCNADAKQQGKQSKLRMRIQEALEGVKVLVIDERSMVGRGVHGMMKTRLEEAFPENGPYGGLTIVWLGDDAQLPPVRACKLHDHGQPTKKRKAKSKDPEGTAANGDRPDSLDWEAEALEFSTSAFELVGLKAWEEFFKVPTNPTTLANEDSSEVVTVMVFHLVQNVRALNSPELLALTTCIRHGKVDQNTYDTICTRNFAVMSDSTRDEFHRFAVKIVDKQSKRVRANAEALASMCSVVGCKVARILAQDTLTVTGATCNAAISTSQAGGLCKTLYLAVGAQVMCEATHGLSWCSGDVHRQFVD